MMVLTNYKWFGLVRAQVGQGRSDAKLKASESRIHNLRPEQLNPKVACDSVLFSPAPHTIANTEMALVGYGSSDDESDMGGDVQEETPMVWDSPFQCSLNHLLTIQT
jgi:hypothetical protein